MNKNKFNYKWHLKDNYKVNNVSKNNLKVFGTFICGGGSTMGYKLAGYNHLGGVEIDKNLAEVYKTNHNPKYFFLQDIREFVKRNDLPDELYNLDLLDGSPPCSSFSMAGNREKDWGKSKIFREGQSNQVLDDLFFVYIALAKKLQPKIVLAENVKGLIQGNAKSYVRKIKLGFEDAGYKVQLFKLNAATMGVPQRRERVFFICQRNDLKFPKLQLIFNEKSILFSEIKDPTNGKPITGKMLDLWKLKKTGETTLQYSCLRKTGKENYFGSKIQLDNKVPFTIIASDSSPILHDKKPFEISEKECKLIGSFPLDFNFKKVIPKYLIGMSVPPVMTAQIAHQIYLQWLRYVI